MTTSSCVLSPAIQSDDTLARSSAASEITARALQRACIPRRGTNDLYPDKARWFKSTPAHHQIAQPINTRRFALFLFPGSYSENQFANYLPTFRAIRYLYSLALLHDAPLANATSSKTRNDRWSCRPSRTKLVITCRLSMPAEVSCEETPEKREKQDQLRANRQVKIQNF
jgi:hypothetical protein